MKILTISAYIADLQPNRWITQSPRRKAVKL